MNDNGNPKIEGPNTLPEFFANVSNFHCLDENTLKKYGWLPYEKRTENKEIFVSSNFEILGDMVIENIVTRDKNEEERSYDDSVKISQEWSSVRKKRDELLSQSDKDVVVDKWLLLDEDTKLLWTKYRKKLRDLPQEFQNPFDVVFPSLSSET
jgi:hypothetical protein